MSIKSKVRTACKDPLVIVQKMMGSKASRILPDKIALKIHFRTLLKRKLSLSSPRSFNEKIQWLKLHDRNDSYPQLVDKHEVKKFIADFLGEGYIIPTIAGPYDSFDEINFDELPNRFVIKCTHDSAGLVICRDKEKLDKEAARKKIEASLNNNFYWRYREWVYKEIRPRIIVEKYMESKSDENVANSLTDYKFFTFNGRTKFLYISDGLENHDTAHVSFFDLEGKQMPFKRLDYNGFTTAPAMPSMFKEMIELADALSKKVGAPFLRVDLYEIKGHIYFSELTFYPHAGFIPFDPVEWDGKLGDMMDLGIKQNR